MDVFQQLAQQSLPLLLAMGWVLAFAESALGVGLVFPGEATITGLAIATTGLDRLGLLGAAVALGAVAGDHAGYLVGRRFGGRLRATRLIGRAGVGRWDRATDQLRRHGMLAVLVSRLLPVVRTVMPAVAGVARLSYPRFLTASALGAVLWSGFWVGLGSGARALLGTNVWILGLVAVACILAVLLVPARHRRRSWLALLTEEPSPSSPTALTALPPARAARQ